jgi:hypothetical protein
MQHHRRQRDPIQKFSCLQIIQRFRVIVFTAATERKIFKFSKQEKAPSEISRFQAES